jgi:AAHS family 4-hydroxybenzoate transporter-like MFS transporter
MPISAGGRAVIAVAPRRLRILLRPRLAQPARKCNTGGVAKTGEMPATDEREEAMMETPLSAPERALENQKIGGLQIRVMAICMVVQMCDGYDVNSIGVSVPQLTHVWHLPGPAFTTAFLWSSIGILVGALAAGPIGDRFGRKPLLIWSLLIFGIASVLSAFAGSLTELTVLRFFTGLGIGGGFPGAASLTGDYAPHRRRALMIMLSFTGAPIGGFLCGQGAGLLLPTYGWPSIFLIGGVVPLVLVGVMALWLPESPRILARKAALTPREEALLRRLDIGPAPAGGHALDVAHGNPVGMLFGKGYALQTILMWIIFFCSLMNLFLFIYWTPEVLHMTGLSPATAARAASFRELGGILAVVYLGVLIDRFGPERALALNYAAGIVFIGLIALVSMSLLPLIIVIFFSGMTIIGSQTGANAACGKLYPARMRTSGLGWALGIGRLGGIAAPILGGYLLRTGMSPLHIFLSACLFALIAAIATGLLAFRGSRVEQLALQEAALSR